MLENISSVYKINTKRYNKLRQTYLHVRCHIHIYIGAHTCAHVCACVRITKVQENTNIEHNGNNNVRNDWKRAVDAATAVAVAAAAVAAAAATAATGCPVSVRHVSQSQPRGSRRQQKQPVCLRANTHNKSPLQIDWNYRKTIYRISRVAVVSVHPPTFLPSRPPKLISNLF